MHIPLPHGDVLIPEAEFLELAGGVTPRTANGWDHGGCPFTYIGNRKYRPKTEALNWLAAQIRRRNPRRVHAAARAAAWRATAIPTSK
jgi:hypothetical protein